MKLRVKHIEGLGYFLQVREPWYHFAIGELWSTVGSCLSHYPEKYTQYPMKDQKMVEARAILYTKRRLAEARTTTYTPWPPIDWAD